MPKNNDPIHITADDREQKGEVIRALLGMENVFRVALPLELKKLEAIFQHKVFKTLLNEGKITKEMISMLSTWRHSGFHVFLARQIQATAENPWPAHNHIHPRSTLPTSVAGRSLPRRP